MYLDVAIWLRLLGATQPTQRRLLEMAPRKQAAADGKGVAGSSSSSNNNNCKRQMAQSSLPEALKLPRAVNRARDVLTGAGLEVNSTNLKSSLSKKDYNVLGQTLRNSMCPAAKDAYNKLASDEERRNWISRYVVDPSFTTTTGWNANICFTQKSQIDDENWITEEQMSGAMYCNSREHAKLVAESGQLESQLHENPAMAAAGVKVYKWIASVLRREHGEREEAGVKADCELTAPEYERISSDMQKSMGKDRKKKATPPKPKAE